MISTVIWDPVHPFAVGVIVYLTTPALVPVLVNDCAIVLPHAEEQLLNPVIVPPDGGVRIAAVHLYVVPLTLLVNATEVDVAEQII